MPLAPGACLLLAAVAPATRGASAGPTWQQLGFGLLCVSIPAIVAAVIAYFLGAWRSSVQGPPRIERGRPFWPVCLAILAAIFGLFVGGTVVAAWIAAVEGRDVLEEAIRPPSAVDVDPESGARSAVITMQMSAGSYLFATLMALATVYVARLSGWRGGLGASMRQFPRGVLWGVLALLLVIPWMLTASVLLQVVLKAAGIELETVHEIIRAMREFASPELIAWGLVSAVVVAPIAEEVLFRGVLQTTLVHIWARLFDPPLAQGEAMPAPTAEAAIPMAVLAEPLSMSAPGSMPAAPAERPVRHMPSATARWAGIVATSLVFAALHETWSIPVIFLLSLALGYLYERTGNLWTAITVHLGFNAFNMMLALPVILGW